MDKAELQTDKNKVRHAVDGSFTGAKDSKCKRF